MEGFSSWFGEIDDPRAGNSRHDLLELMFVALAAVLCGAEDCTDMAAFARAKLGLLRQVIVLEHGPPSHDTFSRVFRMLEPEPFEAAFSRFMAAFAGSLEGVVAIDGKALRGAYERGRKATPLHLVNVWAAEARMVIGQRLAPGRNEVLGAQQALALLSLQGCIVTADALHCHPRMAEAVRTCGADYAIGLKANNRPLYQAACAAFAAAEAKGRIDSHERHDRGHDRHESRRAAVIAAPRGVPAFPGLVAFGRIEAERRLAKGKIETATRYILLSKRLAPARLLEVTRAHWSVENDLHWQLDVAFHEDDARTRKDFGPENHAVIRRVALDILRAHPADKSIARKMKLAAWSKPFFYELFTHLQ